MDSLLVSLGSLLALFVVPVLAYVLCNVFLFEPVGKIRAYLDTKKSGWARSRYIRIFIGAVRGEAAVFDTFLLGIFILLIPFLMLLWTWSGAMEIEINRRALQHQYDSYQRQHDFLTALRSGAKLEINREALDAEIQRSDAEIQRKFPALLKRHERDIFIRHVFSIGCGLIGVYMLFVWFPYVLIRKQFDHELTRFMLRIQGLASKAELAELAVAEGRVTNEQTLRIFVDKVKAIAVRHEVPQLVSTFDLWKYETK